MNIQNSSNIKNKVLMKEVSEWAKKSGILENISIDEDENILIRTKMKVKDEEFSVTIHAIEETQKIQINLFANRLMIDPIVDQNELGEICQKYNISIFKH
jgi:hypothetical protein